MDVRCPRCRRPVSEWAARCPSCRADLSQAELIASDPFPGPDPPSAHPLPARPPPAYPPPAHRPPAGPPPAADRSRPRPDGDRSGEVEDQADLGAPPRRPRSPRRRVAAVAALAAALVVGVVVATSAPSAHRRTGPPPASAGPPAAEVYPGVLPPAMSSVAGAAAERLRAERLFLAEGSLTEAVLADGTVLERFGPSVGAPAQPVPVGGDTVVFQRAGAAWAFDLSAGAPTDADLVLLGPARQVFPAGPGQVYLVQPSYGRLEVTVLGLADPLSADSFSLAGADRVVGGSADGLLLEAPDRVLELISAPAGATRAVTGPISQLVAVSGDEVAWTSERGCDSALTGDCPLHLTDLATRVERVIHVPGVIGFAGVGAFSPDQQDLAVYALAGRRQASPRLGLVVVRTADGTARSVGSVLVAGAVTPTVAWSPTGEWLYFGGSGSFDAVDVAPADPSGAPSEPVPLPLSVACCVVGF